MNYLEMDKVQRQWTDGYDLPWEGSASAGNDLLLGFCTNERFPKISRTDMRNYAAARGDSIWALVKMTGGIEKPRKLFGTDFGWVEVPYEDDLSAAVGL